VDTWAIGCILYELYERRPLFIGDSEIDQIFKIFQFWGTPSEDDWPGITQIPEYKPSFPRFRKINPYKAIKNMPEEAINLMLQLITLDPTQRISSIDALKHPYFNS
jgi:serine/threonine protein kinase